MTHPSILAIIPARGGSKGLVRKNIADLGGQPLLCRSIAAGLGCALVSQTVVSTEDPEIRTIALAHGADVIDRPAELAADQSQIQEAVLHALGVLGKAGPLPDYIALLQPTSPFRTAAHLLECAKAFFASDAASAVSVTECEHHPYKTLLDQDGTLTPLIDADKLEMRRQDLPAAYRTNGAIYLLSMETFLQSQRFFVPPVLPYFMDARSSLDIDTAMDLLTAQLLLEAK